MISSDKIARLLQRLVLAIEDRAPQLPLVCDNCNEALIILCTDCEHYDGDPEVGCPTAEEIAQYRCTECGRALEQSHSVHCWTGKLLYEAREAIRELESKE